MSPPGMMTVDGEVLLEHPDLQRMRRDRHTRLQEQLDIQGLDAVVLLGTSAVSYATGAAAPSMDNARASLFRPVAVVVRGDDAPHLFTPYPEGSPAELPPDHLHGPLYPDLDEGAAALAGVLCELCTSNARLGVDELTHPMARAFSGFDLVTAAGVLGPAKLCKTPDELACIRAAQHVNELAMADVQFMLRPGIRPIDLSARFFRRIFELGIDSAVIDPIWQAMPTTRATGPWTANGDVAFPTPSTDRAFQSGEVVWVDSGIERHGYSSDFGRTWIVGVESRATGVQRAQYQRWRAVVDAVLERCKPGVSGLELVHAAVAANGGTRPWIDHLYLAHGVGTDIAEPPMIGTDLGAAFDERVVLAPGMVLVLEPVIWDDGDAGYRSEDIIAITDDGWLPLSDYPYDPYEDRS